MFVIECNFLKDFKLGDNINHNLNILCLLYKHYDDGNDHDKNLLHKPIIILLTSIIEALLFDFHQRVNHNVREQIVNLKKETISHIRNKKLDKFSLYISSAKKHDFFDLSDTSFYEVLKNLLMLRNRIHIQNQKRYSHADEIKAFNAENKELAEKVLEIVVRTMNRKFQRPLSVNYVKPFTFPWRSYYDNNS